MEAKLRELDRDRGLSSQRPQRWSQRCLRQQRAVPPAQGLQKARHQLAKPARTHSVKPPQPCGDERCCTATSDSAGASADASAARAARSSHSDKRTDADQGGRIMVRYFYAWTPLVIVAAAS